MKAIINVMRTKTPQKNGKGRKKNRWLYSVSGREEDQKTKEDPFVFFLPSWNFSGYAPGYGSSLSTGPPFFRGGGGTALIPIFPFKLTSPSDHHPGLCRCTPSPAQSGTVPRSRRRSRSHRRSNREVRKMFSGHSCLCPSEIETPKCHRHRKKW